MLLAIYFFVLPRLGFDKDNIGETSVFEGPAVRLKDEMPVLYDEDSPYFTAFKNADRINILMLGLNDNLADTIMLASFDYEAKKVDLISVPRDTYYFREKYAGSASYLKINAIYQATDNPLETAMAVSKLLKGMPINAYVLVDYAGIEKIVDTMGGVPMDIPFRMLYSDPSDKPPLYIDIPKGYQILDGEHAVQFLRFRKSNRGRGYPDGDIGRVKAQQEFMKSAFHQMIGFDLPKIAGVIFDNVKSDITLTQTLKIATKAIGISTSDIKTFIMPHTLQDSPPYYVYPDDQAIGGLIDEIYSISVPAPTDGSPAEPSETTEPRSQGKTRGT